MQASVPSEALDPEMLLQSPADLAPDQIAPVSESINDAIDEITAQLAAFCFKQLEKSVTSDDALDLNADITTFTNEFWVRCYTARRPNQYIQCLLFRSFQVSQIMYKELLQT